MGLERCETMRGFTIIELLVTITLMSVAGALIVAPLMVSSRGVGAPGVAGREALVMAARGEAERFSSGLAGLTGAQWAANVKAVADASPQAVLPDVQLNGKTYSVTRSAECFQAGLSPPDAACAAGFAVVTITATESGGGEGYSISFVKTAAGIR